MKYYRIKVNGKTYDVELEEVNGSAAGTQTAAAPAPAQPVQAAPVKAAEANSGAQGAVKVEAAVPGKIVKITTAVSSAVKSGDALVVIESMKMEIPVVAPEDGTVVSVNVSVGDMVETGTVLVTLDK